MKVTRFFAKSVFPSRIIMQVLLFTIFILLFGLPAIRKYRDKEVRELMVIGDH